jgi:hypothetical protein
MPKAVPMIQTLSFKKTGKCKEDHEIFGENELFLAHVTFEETQPKL